MVNEPSSGRALWEARIAKWDYGIEVDAATTEDLTNYMQTKIYSYQYDKRNDDNLWECFKDDFKNFTIDTFKQVPLRITQDLRRCLRCGGVRVVQNTKTATIAQSLYAVLEEEDQAVWTANDIIEAKKDLERGPITSMLPELKLDTIPSPPSYRPPAATPEPDVGIALRQPAARSTGAQIAEIAKIYTDEQKYDGTNGSFDHKLTIFIDICRRVDLPEPMLVKAFPTMLKGLAQDHYYNSQLSIRLFADACTNIRSFFEGPTYHRRNLDEWNNTDLASITAKDDNYKKPIYENVQLLINKLRQLQYCLNPALRTDEFLHNKIVTACQGSPACRYAVSDPPTDIGALINKLQSSITTYEKEQALTLTGNTAAFFTDRRYHRNASSFRPRYTGTRNSYGSSNNRGKCFICKKPHCRSWKHSQQEQDDEKARFKAETASRLNPTGKSDPNTRQFDRRFNERFKQYVSEYEGDDDHSDSDDDELGRIMESLMVHDDEPDPRFNLPGGVNQTLVPPDHTDAFLTTCGSLPGQLASTTTIELANRAFEHQLSTRALESSDVTADSPNQTHDGAVNSLITASRYNATRFYGIMIDTGAAKRSTAGYGQFQALLQIDDSLTLDKSTKGAVAVQFGIGSTSSIGSLTINTPIGKVCFHIVDVDTPFLLCLADMDNLNVYYNNLTDQLITPQGSVLVVRRFGHPFLLWKAPFYSFLIDSLDENPCFLTNVELQRLHRRFGHPSVSRLQAILDRSGHTDVDKQALEHLTKYCKHCQIYSKAPGRFKFNLRDDVDFNFSIIVDIFYIGGKPVLHVIDEGTRYQAGRWLQNISAKHTWDALRACWIDTYLGPPDQITTDAGKNFVSKEFGQIANTMGVKLKAVPIEAHHSIGMVERYHTLVRRAFYIIMAELKDIDKDMALQMAFKAINDSAGPNGLIPTLLVYGAYPRMTDNEVSPTSVTQRALAVKKAMDEIRKIRAEKQVAGALNMRNGPDTAQIHQLTLNSPVLVYREGNTGQGGSWEGPYRLVAIHGEDCVLALPNGNATFRSTSVKPFLTETPLDDTDLPDTQAEAIPEPFATAAPVLPQTQPLPPVKRGRGRPRKHPIDNGSPDITVFLLEPDDEPTTPAAPATPQFTASRQAEINGLLEKGVFEIAPITDVPAGARIFGARFVDEVKNKGTGKAFEKSRLVVQAYADDEKQLVLTQSPTIQRVSQRLLLCLAAMELDTKLYLRDISQAYVQSTTTLNRNFYVRPPVELADQLNLQDDSVLKVVKPLYGVPEAGNHWFKTYHSHHIKNLQMQQSTYDPCLLYSTDPFGVVGLQTDDTLFIGDNAFAGMEQEQLEKAGFLAKDRDALTSTSSIKFNGGIIQLEANNTISLSQERQCANLRLIGDSKSTTSTRGTIRSNLTLKDQYIAQRARGAYVASVCQPEASYDLSVAAQSSEHTNDDIKLLNKRLQWQIENSGRGLQFVKLDKASLKLLVFTDASFANNKDLSSQIGYILVLADANRQANIIHWSSIKCKRVTRSVLASELYGMTHGFDIGAAIKSTIDRILQTNLPLVICTDSKSLYDCLVKLGTTQEKRLMIDVMCLRQAYERRDIAEVRWIKGTTNPADSMTKEKASNALKQLVDTNNLQLEVMEWVERTGIDGIDDGKRA
jgi:hypothetical protein